MKRVRIFLLLIFVCFSVQNLPAQDDFDFGADEVTEELPVSDSGAGLSLHGSVWLDSSVQTEAFRWIRLGPAVHLILDFPNEVLNIYGEATARLNGAYSLESDPQSVIDEYTFEMILRELYAQKNLENLTFTIGNKMVVWSEADILPVMDLISVADMTESLFANPEEARLGQNIIAADLFVQKWEYNFIFSPWPVYNRVTDEGHPYALVPGIKINAPANERAPEWAGRARTVYERLSLSFTGGRVANRTPLFSLGADLISLDPLYEPFYFTGFGSTLALDPFLLKLEARYAFDKPFQHSVVIPVCTPVCANTAIPSGFYREDELAFSVGTDLNVGDAGFFIFEGSVVLPESNFHAVENAVWMAALGWSVSLFLDQVSFSIFTIFAESVENIIFRTGLDWALSDDISVSVHYTGIWMGTPDEAYQALAAMDRATFLVKYHFNMGR